MGCGNSLDAGIPRKKGKKKGKKGKKGRGTAATNDVGVLEDDFAHILSPAGGDGVNKNVLAGGGGSEISGGRKSKKGGGAATNGVGGSGGDHHKNGGGVGGAGKKDSPLTLSKDKFVGCYGCLTQEMGPDCVLGQGLLLVFSNSHEGLSICFRKVDGTLYGHEFKTEQQLKHAKDSAGITFQWSAVFKSLNAEMSKGAALIGLNREKAVTFNFNVRGGAKGESGAQNQPSELFTIIITQLRPSAKTTNSWFLSPMIMKVHADRREEAKVSDFVHSRLECGVAVSRGNTESLTQKVDKLKLHVQKYKKKSDSATRAAESSQKKIAEMESKRLKLISRAKETADKALAASGRQKPKKHFLDKLYEDGGAAHFNHSEYSEAHFPKPPDYDQALAKFVMLRMKYKKELEDEDDEIDGKDEVPQAPPAIRQVALSLFPSMDKEALGALEGKSGALWQVLSNIERWEYDVFEVEKLTNGNALFFTCYALMYRLNLVNHFGIEDKILRNFLLAVQAGYHPNPYHNSMHAADVCHILTFIVQWGGLQEVCPLVQEETLAAVLAGAIHDYDHPGFNNNFHTRTNAYLSTLYNDRSILENHHLACVFEMLRLPKYNIFANMDDEVKKEVRDTMVECVLSTDMGIHAKIIAQFQSKVAENCAWSQKKEHVRLLLSMCTKVADTSNCGRPTNLYTGWAKNIASEFYDQGDTEQRLKLDVSPFMNRSRHLADFAKGQSSFISFVIEPMFKLIAEVLPNMEFIIGYSADNKEYWTKHTPGDLGPIKARAERNEEKKKSNSNNNSDNASTMNSSLKSHQSETPSVASSYMSTAKT